MIIPQEGTAVTFASPGMPAPMRPGGVFVTAQAHESTFTQAVELIGLWAEQYRQGLLTQDEFMTLVAGRVAVMYMGGQAVEAMLRIASLAPAEYPLLC